MGIVGKDKVLREIIEAREGLEKKINQYFEILKLLLTKKRELSSEEQDLLSIPIDHDLWLEAISRFKLKYQIFYLRHLIVILKNVIKRIEIIDKDEAPESYTTALQVYEYNLDSLVEVEDMSKELEQDIPPYGVNDKQKDTPKAKMITSSRKKKNPEDFKSLLDCENKEALMQKLHELLNLAEKKNFAFAIHALILLGYIKERSAKLYRSMRNEFGDIGSDANLNKALIKLEKVKEDDITMIPYIKKLKPD